MGKRQVGERRGKARVSGAQTLDDGAYFLVLTPLAGAKPAGGDGADARVLLGLLTFFSVSVKSLPGLELTHLSQHRSVILPTTAWICRKAPHTGAGRGQEQH